MLKSAEQIRRLNDALKKFTDSEIAPFPFKSVSVQKYESNDRGFFVMMFLKHYDADDVLEALMRMPTS